MKKKLNLNQSELDTVNSKLETLTTPISNNCPTDECPEQPDMFPNAFVCESEYSSELTGQLAKLKLETSMGDDNIKDDYYLFNPSGGYPVAEFQSPLKGYFFVFIQPYNLPELFIAVIDAITKSTGTSIQVDVTVEEVGNNLYKILIRR